MLGIILAVISTLLVVSLAFSTYLILTRRRWEAHWLARETRALDRARAAEIRAGQQVDAMLDRVAVMPTVSMEPVERVADVDATQRTYFADDDDPTEQAAWDKTMDRVSE